MGTTALRMFALVAVLSTATNAAVGQEKDSGPGGRLKSKSSGGPGPCPDGYGIAHYLVKGVMEEACYPANYKNQPCAAGQYLEFKPQRDSHFTLAGCRKECGDGLVENPVHDYLKKYIQEACIPPAQVKYPRGGKLRPSYYVLALLYSPPGNSSTVDYGKGSSFGTSTELKHVVKNGITATATVGVLEAEGHVYGGAGFGSVVELRKESSTSIGLTSQTDELNHEKDAFYIWTNPEMHLVENKPGEVAMTLQTHSKERMQITSVTVAELRNPALLPAYKKKALAGLKPEDYQSILALNPLAVAGAKPDLKRFRKLADTLQLDGPDTEKGDIPNRGLDQTYEEAASDLKGVVAGAGVSVTVGSEFSLFGLMKVGFKAGRTFDYEFERTQQTTTGKQEVASVRLATSTVRYHRVYQVYYDTAFKTFAFVLVPKKNKKESPVLVGKVTRGKQPLANQEVTVTLPDKSRRRVRTNALGRYQIFDLPGGEHQVKVAGQQRAVEIAPESSSAAPVDVDVDLDVEQAPKN